MPSQTCQVTRRSEPRRVHPCWRAENLLPSAHFGFGRPSHSRPSHLLNNQAHARASVLKRDSTVDLKAGAKSFNSWHCYETPEAVCGGGTTILWPPDNLIA